jgi:hypothetical protein
MMNVAAVLPPNFKAMPAELRGIPRWVVWKGLKVPYCPTAINSKASVIEPDTWATFDHAQSAYEEGGYLGVGFVLSGDGVVGVDLDKCVHAGQPEPAALGLLDRVGCRYIEVSPSGTGLRGFGYGSNITGRRGQIDGVNVELYASKRYLTVTGRTLVTGPLVTLPGFSELADAIRPPDLQKRTEDDRSNLLFSSVGVPPSTLPAQAGQRNRCLFELARYLRGRIPQATREELRALVMTWHDLALPVIGTKDFAITWADFLNGWAKVQKPFGSTMQTITDTIDHTAALPKGIDAWATASFARDWCACASPCRSIKGPSHSLSLHGRQVNRWDCISPMLPRCCAHLLRTRCWRRFPRAQGRWPVATGLFGVDSTPPVCLDFLHAKWAGVRRAENLRKPETFFGKWSANLTVHVAKSLL